MSRRRRQKSVQCRLKGRDAQAPWSTQSPIITRARSRKQQLPRTSAHVGVPRKLRNLLSQASTIPHAFPTHVDFCEPTGRSLGHVNEPVDLQSRAKRRSNGFGKDGYDIYKECNRCKVSQKEAEDWREKYNVLEKTVEDCRRMYEQLEEVKDCRIMYKELEREVKDGRMMLKGLEKEVSDCSYMCRRLEKQIMEYKELREHGHGHQLENESKIQRVAASGASSVLGPKSGATCIFRYEPTTRYRVGISYETPQQQEKYSSIAEEIVWELGLSQSAQQGATPDKDYDIVLHFARTDGGRTVNLDLQKRMAFNCEHVVLVLLRSGKNEAVFSKFVPVSQSEYSGINLKMTGLEKRSIVQFLHWDGELFTSNLNKDNLELLKQLMVEACPGIFAPVT